LKKQIEVKVVCRSPAGTEKARGTGRLNAAGVKAAFFCWNLKVTRQPMIDHPAARRSLPIDAIHIEPIHRHVVCEGEVRHILVPVTLAENELPAVRLGVQMAAGTQALVTVLNVGPVPSEYAAGNWLDSIDRLHDSLGAGPTDGATLARRMSDELKAFVGSAGVAPLLAQTRLSLISRPGDFCDEVLRFAQAQQVDVVVLAGNMLHGWLPVVPSRLRRKLQQAGKRILAVWPEADRARSPQPTETSDQAAFAC